MYTLTVILACMAINGHALRVVRDPKYDDPREMRCCFRLESLQTNFCHMACFNKESFQKDANFPLQSQSSRDEAAAPRSPKSLARLLLAASNSEASAFHSSAAVGALYPAQVARSTVSPSMSDLFSKFGGRDFKWDKASGLYMMPDKPDKDPEVEPGKEPDKPGPSRQPPQLPMVGSGDDKVDVISRLLRDRILLLGSQVDDTVANLLVAQLLYLANEDGDNDITLYINSPGGSVSAGLAIFDTMNFVPCDVGTVCFGTAASMGAFLLGSGTKGKRRSLPNSRIMIHQPLGGAAGQAADIEIQAKEILYIRAVLCEYIADHTGQPVDKVEEDCDRDFFMTPEEAKSYGIIDEVLKSKIRVAKPPFPTLQYK